MLIGVNTYSGANLYFKNNKSSSTANLKTDITFKGDNCLFGSCGSERPNVSISESILSGGSSSSCNTCGSGSPVLSMFESLLNANTPGSRVRNRVPAPDLSSVSPADLLWKCDTEGFIRSLANCTNINARYGLCDYSLLLIAAHHGDTKAVEAILKFPNVDLNVRDIDGKTALEVATEVANENGFQNYAQVAEMIKNYNPHVDGRNVANTQTSKVTEPERKEAAPDTNMEFIVRMLPSTDPAIKQYALDNLIKYIDSDSFNPEYKDEFGRNVIHLALSSKDERIKTVIAKSTAKGVDINSTNISGQTCLIQAIKNLITADDGNEKRTGLSVIRFILDKNPDINLQDKNGMTAFHYACMSSSEPLMEMILSANPNVLIKDLKGRIGSELIKNSKVKDIYIKHLIK